MIKEIEQLILKWACMHKWKVHEHTPVFNDKHNRPIEIRQTLICEKCGKIKKIEL